MALSFEEFLTIERQTYLSEVTKLKELYRSLYIPETDKEIYFNVVEEHFKKVLKLCAEHRTLDGQLMLFKTQSYMLIEHPIIMQHKRCNEKLWTGYNRCEILELIKNDTDPIFTKIVTDLFGKYDEFEIVKVYTDSIEFKYKADKYSNRISFGPFWIFQQKEQLEKAEKAKKDAQELDEYYTKNKEKISEGLRQIYTEKDTQKLEVPVQHSQCIIS